MKDNFFGKFNDIDFMQKDKSHFSLQEGKKNIYFFAKFKKKKKLFLSKTHEIFLFNHGCLLYGLCS